MRKTWQVVILDRVVVGTYRLRREAVAHAIAINETFSEYRRKYEITDRSWLASIREAAHAQRDAAPEYILENEFGEIVESGNLPTAHQCKTADNKAHAHGTQCRASGSFDGSRMTTRGVE